MMSMELLRLREQLAVRLAEKHSSRAGNNGARVNNRTVLLGSYTSDPASLHRRSPMYSRINNRYFIPVPAPCHQNQSRPLGFGVQPLGCATQRRLKPVLQTEDTKTRNGDS